MGVVAVEVAAVDREGTAVAVETAPGICFVDDCDKDVQILVKMRADELYNDVMRPLGRRKEMSQCPVDPAAPASP